MQSRNTYNLIKPPKMDGDVIVFAFSRYVVPEENQRQSLFNILSQSILDKNYDKMYETLTNLEDFRISRTKVTPRLKQTEVVEATKGQKRMKKDEQDN